VGPNQKAKVGPNQSIEINSCWLSKPNVSRDATEASQEALQELLERRFDDLDLLVIYIDGMVFGEQHMVGAVGVDAEGRMCWAFNRERPRMLRRSRIC
jgi:hypothetical protein